jgi:ribonuclease P protein component
VLPKSKRLVTSREILDAMKTKHQLRTNYFHIRIKKREEGFGFISIISKKISKRANKRNLLKRKSHAVISELLHKKELPHGISVVAQVTQKSALEANYAELKIDLLDGLGKLYFKYIQCKDQSSYNNKNHNKRTQTPK